MGLIPVASVVREVESHRIDDLEKVKGILKMDSAEHIFYTDNKGISWDMLPKRLLAGDSLVGAQKGFSQIWVVLEQCVLCSV